MTASSAFPSPLPSPSADGAAAPAPAGAPRRAPNAHLSDFTALSARIKSAGLLQRAYGHYWRRLIGLPLIGAALVVAFLLIGDSWWQMLIAAAFALLMTQVAFLGHDAAHRQIFASARWNEWVSLLVVNLGAGMGLGWWNGKHSKHHGSPNTVGTDPDIAPGVLVFAPGDAQARRTRLGRWLTARQGLFFFPLLLLEGVNLHVQGISRLLSKRPIKRRAVELTFIAVRLVAFFALIFLVLSPGRALAFAAVELGVFGLCMGLAFAPNHIGMPILPKGVKVDFLRRQVLMSRNVSGGRMVDVLMGGLNLQIEHHLFPSMARPNLRRAAPIVREYCRSLGVAYHETPLGRSYREVAEYINQAGRGGLDVWACPLSQQLGRG